MSNGTKTILALIIFSALFLDISNLKGIIERITKKESVVSVDPAPTEASIALAKTASDLVTDKEDRATLAIFNLEFAKRVVVYADVINTQQLQDIYVASASSIYGKSISSKYQSLGSELIKLMKSVIGEEEHTLTSEDAKSLSDIFRALSFNLSL
jgi:hypothetical protein